MDLPAGLPVRGSRVIVYWPGAATIKWHHGEVRDIDEQGRSLLAYDDGDRELLHFAMERFKFEKRTSSPGANLSLECSLQHDSSPSTHAEVEVSACRLPLHHTWQTSCCPFSHVSVPATHGMFQ